MKRFVITLFGLLGLAMSLFTISKLPKHPNWEHTKSAVVYLDLYFVDKDSDTVNGDASGFLVSSDGYIVTVAHALRTPEGKPITVEVSTYDNPGVKFKPLVIYVNTSLDIAVLKIKSDTPLPFLSLSTDADDGDSLFMVGHPWGCPWSIYPTMLSSKLFMPVKIVDQESSTMQYLFELSAPMAPGVSGAPVVDVNGRVVCMTHILKVVPIPAAQINFCVPSEVIDHALHSAQVYH